MQFAVEHIGLSSQSPEHLMAWYMDVLGARLVYHNRQKPPAGLLSVGPGCWIEIYPASHSLPETAYNRLAGWRHLALRVPSIADARAWLAHKGVQLEPSEKPAGGGGSVLFFRDPEGNLLHLVERPGQFPA